MKKISAIFAGLALALCLTACNNNETSGGGISAPSLIQSGSAASGTSSGSSTSSSSTTSTSSSETSSSSEESSVTESVSTASSEPSEPSEPEQSNAAPVSSETDAPAESESAPSEPQNGKTLVVYFSASGNTEAVANIIAAHTSADTFELVPTNPYGLFDLYLEVITDKPKVTSQKYVSLLKCNYRTL